MKQIIQVYSFDLLNKIILGVVNLAIIRFMPESEFAIFTLAFSIIVIIAETLYASFNRIYIVGYRDLAAGNQQMPFLGFQLLLIFALILLSLPFRGYFAGVYGGMMAIILGYCLSEFAKTVFQQKLKFVKFSMVEFSKTAISGILIFSLIHWEKDQLKAAHVLSAYAAGMIIPFLLIFGKELNPKKLFHVGEALRIMKQILSGPYKYLFGYSFFLIIFSQLDIIMLKIFSNSSALAVYGVAFRYYSTLLLILGAVHTVLLPSMQNIKTLSDWKGMLQKTQKIFYFFAAFTFICFWAAGWAMPLIDKGKYPLSIFIFRILCVSAVLSVKFSPQFNLLMVFKEFKFMFKIITVGLIINFGLNILLIPAYNAVGVSVATLLAYFFVNYSFHLRAKKLALIKLAP